MIPLIKAFLFDATAFTGAVRAVILMAALTITTGEVTFLPKWVGVLIAGFSAFIRAGQKNPVVAPGVAEMLKEPAFVRLLKEPVADTKAGLPPAAPSVPQTAPPPPSLMP